jgi:Zn-dependent alcohol dehydrogenases
MATSIPKTMRALQYSEPKKHNIVEVPVPEIRENDVLVWKPSVDFQESELTKSSLDQGQSLRCLWH